MLYEVVTDMDLADFLAAELDRTSYRAMKEKTGVSKGALENIIKRTNKDLPTLETLQGIAKGFGKPLWEVVQMAVDLQLPQSPTEQGKRLAAMVERHPRLTRAVVRLQALEHKRPDLVTGMLVTLEVLDRLVRRRPPPNPPKQP